MTGYHQRLSQKGPRMTRREYERELARLIPAFAAEVQALYAELIGTARRRVEAAIATGNADEVIRLLGLGEDEADAFLWRAARIATGCLYSWRYRTGCPAEHCGAAVAIGAAPVRCA